MRLLFEGGHYLRVGFIFFSFTYGGPEVYSVDGPDDGSYDFITVITSICHRSSFSQNTCRRTCGFYSRADTISIIKDFHAGFNRGRVLIEETRYWQIVASMCKNHLVSTVLR